MAARPSAVNFHGVVARTVAGYEHRYRFSIDDEIVNLYKYELNPQKKTYLYEIRTSFIVKKIDGGDHIVDSERFNAVVYTNGNKSSVLWPTVSFRFAEYWMTHGEIIEFGDKVSNFALQTTNNPQYASRLMIPIVVHLEVHTVQQDGETLDTVNDRVIRAENLVPYYIWPPMTMGVHARQVDPHLRVYMLRLAMLRTRVEDTDKEVAIMPVCGICSRGPKIGTHITVIPPCNHAFHTHCIIKWLLNDNLCPSCRVRAYPYRFDGPLF